MAAPSWRPWLRRLPRFVLALVAIGLMASTPNFVTPGTIGSIVLLGSIVGVLAVGQTFVLIGGGFDLSQGATMAMTAGMAAILVANRGVSPWLAVPIVLALGALLGAFNGIFVAAVGTNPFVTTLSTLLLYRGGAFLLLGGLPINKVTAFEFLQDGLTIRRAMTPGGTLIPNRTFVFLAVTAVSWVVLSRTLFGRHIYAVGGNLQAARLSGLATIRLRVATFALSGMAAALAALMQLSWVRVAKPDTGYGLELDSIAACVVGGISLQGGSGSVIGAALGCLLLQALGTYITMSGFPDEYRSLATGAVILTFAAADALARRTS